MGSSIDSAVSSREIVKALPFSKFYAEIKVILVGG